ncbi:MAG: ATP-binding protein [Actinobacteria bacterium]|nr:ATP-binding protein [Actinomycetota bacterium]
MPTFVNRERELRALDRACSEDGGMAIVSGRRRVGKTALIDRFAATRRAVFLPGTRAPVGEALRRLEDRIRHALPPQPGDLLDLGHLDTWDAALGYLLARARDEPFLLILDEFPYLCESDQTLPSTLQARWDHRGDSHLSVVLAGSHVGLMEELVSADAPLFGRADAHLRLAPFSWREAPLLVGGNDPETWFEAYCTVGGMPRYLTLWDPREDLLTNLTELLDGPGAPLGDEGTVVLQELTPGSAAARVLELIALGAESFSVLRERTGLAPASTSEALALLEALRLIERVTPVGEDARRTRRVRYEVRDAFLRLWLAVVLPHREAFELGRGAGVLTANRSTLATSQQRGLRAVLHSVLADAHQADCGPWWATAGDAEVDALALAGGAAVAAGSAQWTTNADADRERARIRDVLADSPYAEPDEVVVLARDGQGVTRPADLYVD